MTDKHASESNLSPLLRKISAILVELNDSHQAAVFRNHIEQTLVELESNHARILDTYVSVVDLLIDAFAAQLPSDSVALSHLKLIKTCLTPPLSLAELSALHQNVVDTAEMLNQSSLVNEEQLSEEMMPVLERITGMQGEQQEEEPSFPQPTPKEAKKRYDVSTAPAPHHSDYDADHDESLFSNESPVSENVNIKDGDKTFSKPKLVEPMNLDIEESIDLELGQEEAGMSKDDMTSLETDSQQDIFDNVKTASLGFGGDREEHKPLKAPKAVLKMLRFPEQTKQEIDGLSNSDSDEVFAEGTSETDSLMGDYPMNDDYDGEVSESSKILKAELENEEDEVLDSYEHDEMENLNRDFIKQLREVVAENTEFGVHLGLEIDALDEATKINQIEDRKKIILASMKKISESHTELAKKFDAAQNYLSVIESDKQKLSDELNRARMLSLTDDLTALPNRRAFIRRLDDEVSRVKRYGFPLSLVLIDIDHFKQVNDEFGHSAGDRVLRVYAEKILSIFRHHDMIARYGGEEFAVLLPNTNLEGVLRALDKVKANVPNVQIKLNGKTIAAPTFSAGVTEYRAPESPSQLIERADHALYRAKRLGRNRIEMERKGMSHDSIDQT